VTDLIGGISSEISTWVGAAIAIVFIASTKFLYTHIPSWIRSCGNAIASVYYRALVSFGMALWKAFVRAKVHQMITDYIISIDKRLADDSRKIDNLMTSQTAIANEMYQNTANIEKKMEAMFNTIIQKLDSNSGEQ